ncbi:helix-turn-helix transcriptional regulator [Acrocarpospora sp. B8E8]|uniref:helix-turn-helix domain-containing protein n=1 Tax=Acrocarpospora sp. B8E8 TaxID=3153572 RepID=UPI00325D33A5
MPASPSSSAQQARKAIGSRLRAILRQSGLTSRALARQAGWDESRCSRLMSGRTPPTEQDIEIWCRFCGVPEEIPGLIAASRTVESAYMEWRQFQRSQKHLNEMRRKLFEETRLYRFYSSTTFPWPVQAPGYMRVLMLRSAELHRADPPDIEDAIQVRVDRQRLLDDGTRRAAILVEEAALRAQPFRGEVMREQLNHLLVAMRRPNVSLGVVPIEGRRVQKPAENFHLYDDTQVFIELLTAAVTITQPREIALYVQLFEDLAAEAVYGAKASALINAALESQY